LAGGQAGFIADKSVKDKLFFNEMPASQTGRAEDKSKS
jgi:hypothetical protein